MHIGKTTRAALAALLVTLAGQAGAAAILVGDVDGFGSGNTVSSGDGFDVFGVLPESFGDSTDDLYFTEVSLSFVYSVPSNVQSASLQIFAGGWGLHGQAKVLFNGTQVGLLTDNDDGDLLRPYEGQTSSLDTILLDLSLVTLTGNDELTIQIAQDPTTADPFLAVLDVGAIDFAVLDITTSGGQAPEPASLALAALGLAAIGASRRRRGARGR